MYKVIFEYADGRQGTCIEDGNTIIFTTEQDAQTFATKLNNTVEEEAKPFFPVWRAEKV